MRIKRTYRYSFLRDMNSISYISYEDKEDLSILLSKRHKFNIIYFNLKSFLQMLENTVTLNHVDNDDRIPASQQKTFFI
jgi:hypothetical protein